MPCLPVFLSEPFDKSPGIHFLICYIWTWVSILHVKPEVFCGQSIGGLSQSKQSRRDIAQRLTRFARFSLSPIQRDKLPALIHSLSCHPYRSRSVYGLRHIGKWTSKNYHLPINQSRNFFPSELEVRMEFCCSHSSNDVSLRLVHHQDDCLAVSRVCYIGDLML
jgi:hypothetical protein